MIRVLLLEPDNKLGKIYEAALLNFYDVERCQMAEQAIAMLDKKTFDVVVLEIQIALHNGIEFLYEMRSYSEWQSIPVIIHSHISPQWFEQCGVLKEQLNIAKFLYKPTTKLQTLCLSIQEHVAPRYV
jgi:DNA-binding NtrC family response regulator